MHLPMDRDVAKRIGRYRVKHWFRVQHRMRDRERLLEDDGLRLFQAERNGAEELARAALDAAVTAFNLLDDLAFDYDLSNNFELFHDEPFERRSQFVNLGDVIDQAHSMVHRAGELVGGLFGCALKHTDRGWFDACPTQLMHVRLGQSPGMIVKLACSVCNSDPGDCPHKLGEVYDAVAARHGDQCTICGESEQCGHTVGSVYPTVAGVLHRDLELREVSLVPRPRDPLARIKERSIDPQELIDQFGRVPDSRASLRCHGCMYPCEGVRRETDRPPSREG
jgi:hypothetical protein